MNDRKQYIKPLALNLSGFGVVGQEPLGTCANGTSPTAATCGGGDFVTQDPLCSPTGISPTLGRCSPGGAPDNDCISGTIFH